MEQTLDGLCVRVAHNHTFDGLWLRMANDFNRLQGKSAIRVSAHVSQLSYLGLRYAVSCQAALCYAVLPHAVLSCSMLCCNLQHFFHAVAHDAVLCCVWPALQLFGRVDMSYFAVYCYLSARHNADLLHRALFT